ncbi:DUF4158 domain-containing protein [Paenibacillus piri]|nr:DUF4158 domain-containing protein [Paenibacillus piri]
MRGKELLTVEQREEFMKIPSKDDWDLGTYYTKASVQCSRMDET